MGGSPEGKDCGAGLAEGRKRWSCGLGGRKGWSDAAGLFNGVPVRDGTEVFGDFFLHDAGGVLTIRHRHFYGEFALIESTVLEPDDIQHVKTGVSGIGVFCFRQLTGHGLFEPRFYIRWGIFPTAGYRCQEKDREVKGEPFHANEDTRKMQFGMARMFAKLLLKKN